MVDYILGDRGSVEIVTDGYYEAETLQVFEELHIDRERIWFWYEVGLSEPEPDNPYEPKSIAVYIDELKVGRMSVKDSAAYWEPITRVVASGYVPVVHLQLSAIARRVGEGTRIESYGVLSLSAPGSLFPINQAPARAALLPQGQSMKVLDEKDHSEYLHSILPPNGEGRVILTLEANQMKLSDGRLIDTVEVLHDRKLVGRLSTQMSAQLAPVVKYAYDRNRLTSAWGTIRGNSLKLSLTVQALRASEIPAEWYRTLPNNVPELLPEGVAYEVPDAYVATEGENNRSAIEESTTKKRRGFMSALTGGGAPAETAAPETLRAEGLQEDSTEAVVRGERRRLLTLMSVTGLAALLIGLIVAFSYLVVGFIIMALGAVLVLATLYVGRQMAVSPSVIRYADYEAQKEAQQQQEKPEKPLNTARR